MEAKSTDKKTFHLIENDEQLGVLIYESLFFLNAEIKLTNSEVYKIKPAGLFQTSIAVTKNEIEIADLKMNWSGQIVFTFQDSQVFVLKAKSLFHTKYTIENSQKEKLIQFDPKFNWNKSYYNYDITCNEKRQDILLVLLGLYASNYFIAIMTGANAGME